jgi:hypothetical protein
MSRRQEHLPERDQLELFRALPGDLAPRDAQDLMAYPFFSLAKSHRTTPIDYHVNNIAIRVEAVPEHGMATIWDADVLIWAASQIVEARDSGVRTSRLMAATPCEILTFAGRGTSARDYHRLKAALDRLQSTTVATTLRQNSDQRMHRFSWINEWTQRTDVHGNADGIDLIVPDWFYRAVLDDALVLTIDPAYFRLTGGLERWLYRLVRKHGGLSIGTQKGPPIGVQKGPPFGGPLPGVVGGRWWCSGADGAVGKWPAGATVGRVWRRRATYPQRRREVVVLRCRVQARCLNRQLSLPVSTMSQWWVRRSSKAAVILASPNTLGQSPNARFVVTMIEVCS